MVSTGFRALLLGSATARPDRRGDDAPGPVYRRRNVISPHQCPGQAPRGGCRPGERRRLARYPFCVAYWSSAPPNGRRVLAAWPRRRCTHAHPQGNRAGRRGNAHGLFPRSPLPPLCQAGGTGTARTAALPAWPRGDGCQRAARRCEGGATARGAVAGISKTPAWSAGERA